MRRVESLLVAVLSVLPSVALAQGAIRGRVADAAGAPLTRATITADAPGLRATSDDQGRYEIRGVAPFKGATDRHLHLFEKIEATPTRFPRRPGMARKRPLGG